SKRSMTTANPKRASEFSSMANWRFSPIVNSDLAGARRSSMTLGNRAFVVEGTSVTALFGPRSSTGAVTMARLFALSAVVETGVEGDTTFLRAGATSRVLFRGESGCGVREAVFGCGIESAWVLAVVLSFATVGTG